MVVSIQKSSIASNHQAIVITGSKSESNRLLLLKAFFPEIQMSNLSNSDDTKVMLRALESDAAIIDIHHAGTAMRFLTAYFAIQDGREAILTGSNRMKERPIKVLVDALSDLDADITYLEAEGCPPLKIKGKKLQKNTVNIKANVSSQYISALLLIATKLKNGLNLNLDGDITSITYLKMTLDLLNQVGIETSFIDNKITVIPQTSNLKPINITVESDWSSASYYYSIVALSDIDTEIKLSSYKKNSLQGDAVLVDIYKNFGVETSFEDHSIILKKINRHQEAHTYDLKDSPDIAQTIAVTCFGLGVACHLTGLHTLKIKETDRLLALKIEIEKLGADVKIDENSLTLLPTTIINENISIATYNDHRMAMAFAPLALKTDIHIEDAMVVSKSYPTFWKDLKTIGFKITEY